MQISMCVTSQPGLKVIARNANILPAILSRCTVPFTGAQAIAKRILKRRSVSKEVQKRCDIWIEFCKRKSFVPSKCMCLCSLNFSQDAYIPSHSPYFLESINFSGKRKLILKPDAVLTINKALDVAKSHKPSEAKKRQTGILSRRKVSVP